MKSSLSLIVLTKNEELHLGRCLESVKDLVEQVFVIDCGSQDRTRAIAESCGAHVFVRPFTTHAEQFNWALDHCEVRTEWVMRLDADEYIPHELRGEILRRLVDVPDDISGFFLPRGVVFMGRRIRYGGYYPTWLLRIWRRGTGRVEDRSMDEHVVISRGRLERLRNPFIDENHKSLTWWTEKHNLYATREAEAVLAGRTKNHLHLGGGRPSHKRWIKENAYYRLPMFFRAFFYFLYRYIVRLGFLDGKEGLVFHFLQGCWYRFLVDAKLLEHKLADRAKRRKRKR